MSLENLVGISVDTLRPDRDQIARLLAAADRNIADAGLDGLSAENRFVESVVSECLASAGALRAQVRAWLNGHRPELL